MLPRTLLIGGAALLAACSPAVRPPHAAGPEPGDADGVSVRWDFDRGSLDRMVRVGPDEYRGAPRHWIKADGIGDQYYWWYFRADGARGRTLTFHLDRLTGIYRGNKHEVYTTYTYPVFSYDREVWHRIPDVSYDEEAKSFRFTQAFDRDTVWIAYAHPYPWERAERLLSAVARSPFATVERLGRSRDRRPISLVTVTDPDVPEERKKVVFVQALQHSGEDAGGYMVEGILRVLTADTEQARDLRRGFVFHVVPVMNPDGLFRGITRYNAAMQDLNSLWSDSVVREPEVAAVKRWITEFYRRGRCFSAFLDIHNHTQQGPRNTLIVMDDRFRGLLGDFAGEWRFQKSAAFRGSASEYMTRQYDVPSTTVELSQSHAGDGRYLDVEDYMRLGERMVTTLAEQLGSPSAGGCAAGAASAN